MGSNQKIDHERFLRKLLSGEISSEEKNELQLIIEKTYDDPALNTLMESHWENTDNKNAVVDESKLQMLKERTLNYISQNAKTPHKTNNQNIKILYQYFTRVAAVLFVPLLLISIALYLKLDQKHFDGNHRIVMQEVVASPGSRVHFSLPDSSEVWLNSGSRLVYPVSMAGLAQRKVKLEGEGYFKVAHDKNHPFIVETGRINIQALGTSFDVSNYCNEESVSSILEEGSIALLDKKNREIARIEPGQKATLDKVTNRLIINVFETRLGTSWKDGELIFKDAHLSDMIRQIERWYNCTIHFDPALKGSKFKYTATIKDETIGEILHMLEMSTNTIETEIKNREVYIRKK
jgi:ferric-dicitrate binding protein FerR (iron transport regulator)